MIYVYIVKWLPHFNHFISIIAMNIHNLTQ